MEIDCTRTPFQIWIGSARHAESAHPIYARIIACYAHLVGVLRRGRHEKEANLERLDALCLAHVCAADPGRQYFDVGWEGQNCAQQMLLRQRHRYPPETDVVQNR